MSAPEREEAPSVARAVYWGDVTDTGDGFVLPTGMVALVLADVAGSVRSWEQDPTGMGTSMARFHALVADTVGTHNGVLPTSQGEGDSFLAAFSRASDAVNAVLDLQLALREGDWPVPLEVRVAVHAGEADVRAGGDYVGAAVHRCARLRDVGYGGQVLLSRAAADLVIDRLPDGAGLVDLGTRRLRDLSRPEQVFQLTHPGLPSDFPGLRTLDVLPNNLPVQLTSFVGRDRQVSEVVALVGSTRLVTLTGSGGCGKTRLALQAAAASERFVDGVWFCDLSPVTNGAVVPSLLASVLGLRDISSGDQAALDAVAARLAAARVVVILDNCEHLIEASASLADALLRRCPTVHVLATSREPLGVAGEHVYRVPSLDVPAVASPSDVRPIDAVRACEAVRLFIDRAKQARSNFEITTDNAPAVAQICQRLDGIPLAIELAAARVRTLTPERIAAGLDDRLRLLGAGPRTALARQQTLRASMDWSHGLLSDRERVLLRRLAAFAGGFDLDAAEAVGAGDDLDVYDVLDVLSQLVDRSLVAADEAHGEPRYRLLETVRQYAAEQLAASGDSAATQERHARHYLDLAERADAQLWGPQQKPWIRRLNLDLANVRAALAWAERADDGDVFARLVVAMSAPWEHLGFWEEAETWGRRVMLARGVAPPTRLRLLIIAAGWMAWRAASPEDLDAISDEVRVLTDSLGASRARAEQVRSWAEQDSGTAFEILLGALDAARGEGDQRLVAELLADISNGAYYASRADVGLAAGEEAVAMARAAGDEYRLQEALSRLARLYAALGDLRTARRQLEALADSVDDPHHPVQHQRVLNDLALVDVLLGDYDAGRDLLARASSFSAPWGIHWIVLATSARLSLAVGDVETAAVEARAALVDAETADVAHVKRIVAECELHRGDVVAARRLVDEAMEAATTQGNERFTMYIRLVRASVAAGEGRLHDAEEDAQAALTAMADAGDRVGVALALDALAELARSLDSPMEAARLHGAAEALREETGLARRPIDVPSHEDAVEGLRAALGDDFERAWDEGRQMPWSEAVDYARRGRGERKRPAAGWDALTPTELAVARLVAEGCTNPRIAERLFMARSTVKTHLEHMFTKLDINTRAQLAAAVVERRP